MKIASIISRVLLGLIFTVFGLNGFLHFINGPMPQGAAGQFIGAMFVSHYFHVVALLQIAGGLIMLSGRFVPLGLTLLGPVIVNILLFHICLEPAGLSIAIVTAALSLVVLYAHRSAFAPLLKA